MYHCSHYNNKQTKNHLLITDKFSLYTLDGTSQPQFSATLKKIYIYVKLKIFINRLLKHFKHLKKKMNCSDEYPLKNVQVPPGAPLKMEYPYQINIQTNLRKFPIVGLMTTLQGAAAALVSGEGGLKAGSSIGVLSRFCPHTGHFSGITRHVMLTPFWQCWKHTIGVICVVLDPNILKFQLIPLCCDPVQSSVLSVLSMVYGTLSRLLQRDLILLKLKMILA